MTGDTTENRTTLLGFWVFMMTDAVLFALLFATYGAMLGATAGGPTPASQLKIGPACAETLVLLTSSLTFAMASIALDHDARPNAMIGWMVATLALGLGFLGLEAHDFLTMLTAGAVPMRSGWLSAFFALVPLHGLHVAIGCLWMAVALVQVGVFGRDAQVRSNIARLALFWHFLDIIWIAIFSVVYLQGLTR